MDLRVVAITLALVTAAGVGCSSTEDAPEGSSGSSGNNNTSSSSSSSGGGSSSGGAPDAGPVEGGGPDGGPSATTLETCGAIVPGWIDGEAMFDLGVGGVGGPAGVNAVGISGDTVVIGQPKGGWVRVDAKTRAVLDKGAGMLQGVAQNRFLVADGTTMTVRDVLTGGTLGTFEDTSKTAQLARDGTYVYARTLGSANGDVLTVWNVAGTQQLSRTGNYRGDLFADAAAVRIARDNVVLAVPSNGAPETSNVTYSGKFESWFTDGARFITRANPDLLVYGAGGGVVALLSNAAGTSQTRTSGFGNTVWTFNGIDSVLLWDTATSTSTIEIRKFFQQKAVAHGRLLVAFDEVVDLGVTPPKRTLLKRPSTNLYYTTVAADAAGSFALVDTGGSLEVGDVATGGKTFLGCGLAFSVAGAKNGRTAIATASGHLVMLDTVAKTATTRALPSRVVALSDDASRVAVSRYAPEVYDAPAFTKKSGDLGEFAIGLALTPNGSAVATADGRSGFPGWELTSLATGNKIASGSWDFQKLTSGFEAFAFSPDGTLIAVLHFSARVGGEARVYTTAGAFVGIVPGYPLAWMTNDRLLTSTGIYDPVGTLIQSATYPGWSQNPARRVTASTAYFPVDNVMVDQSTGTTVWTGGVPDFTHAAAGVGEDRLARAAVAGSFVVWAARDESGLKVKSVGAVP